MKGTLQITFFFICSVKYGTPTHVCKLLLIQKFCRQVLTQMGFTAVLRNVKHSTLFPS